MTVIGLTGGIASGKTTVANYLAQLGAKIIDADAVAREVVTPGSPALREIVRAFGPGVLHTDKTLNRKKLAAIVFNDPSALQKLNGITHPRITEIVLNKINAFKRNSNSPQDMLLLMAPLLIEVGLHKLVDKVWVVHIDAGTQLQRVMERDNLTKDEALKRINAQLPESHRLKYAHEIIDNSGSWENTRKQIEKLWFKYTGCVSQ
ncbi:dephospho-CoA kinase [Desulfohalotomaculum tongense]|uniref:dephospho-CoA kinase n=1 Tax=Desulforadius tongensis TaxID=1216062 RepID=UPI001958363E|nr:dephospho-CoA kinase [Desulforadius tongensis]MBM7855052.1 dephospho-CoA kinase [Desulforadius tongensis]